MKSDTSIELLEHRVRELQTAVATLVRQLGLQQQVAAAERAELDLIHRRAHDDVPSSRLIELYTAPPHAQPPHAQ